MHQKLIAGDFPNYRKLSDELEVPTKTIQREEQRAEAGVLAGPCRSLAAKLVRGLLGERSGDAASHARENSGNSLCASLEWRNTVRPRCPSQILWNYAWQLP